jgi:hypothetical protein
MVIIVQESLWVAAIWIREPEETLLAQIFMFIALTTIRVSLISPLIILQTKYVLLLLVIAMDVMQDTPL